METLNEKIVASNKNGLHAGFQLIEAIFDSVEKFALLNAEVAKVLVQEGLTSLQSLAGSKEFGLSEFQAGWRPVDATERLSGYSRNAYRIVQDTGNRLGEILEQRLLESAQELEEWVQEALVASPFGQSEAAASAATTALSGARTAIEQISKAAKQAAGYADATMKAAATATAVAVKGVAG